MTENPPECPLEPSTELFRLYPRYAPKPAPDGTPGCPAWFCGDTDHRFDLPGVGPGTCHVAETLLGAFIEVYIRIWGKGIDVDEVHSERRMAQLSAARQDGQAPLFVDLNSEANHGKRGVDARLIDELEPPYPIPKGVDPYPRSRAFAQTVYEERLAGIKYISTRDPGRKRVNYAFFGRASGENRGILDVASEGAVPLWVMYEASNRFRIPLKPSSAQYPLT
ncbi:RES family NAD+ phosphorylase [Streptomyces sp. NBC_00272]|uniref:RES family NAD+ phosphorylase n=1 Tax=unclassified Streptomyces TaxID=2593676 RepID=UPI003FA71066